MATTGQVDFINNLGRRLGLNDSETDVHVSEILGIPSDELIMEDLTHAQVTTVLQSMQEELG